MFKHISHGQIFFFDSALRMVWRGNTLSNVLYRERRLRQSLPVTIHMKG